LRRAIKQHQQWIEQKLGVPIAETVILEVSINLAQIGVQKIFGCSDPENIASREMKRLRPLVASAETPTGLPPLVGIGKPQSKSDLRALLFGSERNGQPRLVWQDCPLALHLHTVTAPIIAMNVYFHSGPGSDFESMANVLVIRRDCTEQAIRLIEDVARADHQPQLHTLHGDTRLVSGCEWDDLVLDSNVVSLLKTDFESFWEREGWFREQRLPFRRGYLLHGPPGNGKSTAIRAMMTSQKLIAYTLRLFGPNVDDGDLDQLFDRALKNRPAMVLLEDLDRAFPRTGETRSRLSLQQLLNCLDGVGSGEGIVVVATANEPTILDPAILHRPGRFDRVVHFPNPNPDLRRLYFLRRNPAVTASELEQVVVQSQGLSFAQLREAHIVAGQYAFERKDGITGSDLLSGICSLRRSIIVSTHREDSTGFRPLPPPEVTA
jgi:hypothetical protein